MMHAQLDDLLTATLEPQPDAGAQARECAGAVALEAELSLAGITPRSVNLAGASAPMATSSGSTI
jgi:hypothetical protein